LCLEIDGKPVGITLRISRLNQQLVAGLSDRALDLLEIAALVYGADAAVSRARTYLVQRFASSGLDEALGVELIENIPWQGYRLAPDRVTVRQIEQD